MLKASREIFEVVSLELENPPVSYLTKPFQDLNDNGVERDCS